MLKNNNGSDHLLYCRKHESQGQKEYSRLRFAEEKYIQRKYKARQNREHYVSDIKPDRSEAALRVLR